MNMNIYIYIYIYIYMYVYIHIFIHTYIHVPVHGAELSPAEREGPVRARLVFVHKNVKRAVHWLDLVLVALHIHLVQRAVGIEVKVCE
jgi:hypothetical protein